MGDLKTFEYFMLNHKLHSMLMIQPISTPKRHKEPTRCTNLMSDKYFMAEQTPLIIPTSCNMVNIPSFL